MPNFFIYARKSTESEDRQVLSIEAQLKEMRETAARLKVNIKEELIESQSAKEPGRPVFNEMLKRLNKGEVDGVLCWKLDRLARNPIDGASIIWAIKQHGITIHTPSQSYSQHDENIILLYIEFGMAQKYVDDLSKNVTRGLRMKLEKGDWTSIAPLGYLNDRDKGIIPDPERFDLVRKMWDLMLTGSKSLDDVRRIANNQWGLRTKKFKRMGGNPVAKSTVHRMFTNPFYYGYMRHNLGLFKGNHKPIVTYEEFQHVQQILGRPDRPKSKKYNFPFSGGLIKCGFCDCCVTAEFTTNRHGTRYTYYHCSKKNERIKCPERSIRAEQLDEQLIQFLSSLKISKQLGAWILKNVKHIDDEAQLLSDDKIKAIENSLADYENQMVELSRMRYKNYLDDAGFLKEKAKLLQEQQALEEKLNRLRSGEVKLYPLVKKVIHVAHYAAFWFQKASDNDKRHLIETIGSNPILKDKKLLIQAQIPFAFLQKVKNFHSGYFSRFEPSNFGQAQRKKGPLGPSRSALLAQVDDVRTFLEKDMLWKSKHDLVYDRFSGNKRMA